MAKHHDIGYKELFSRPEFVQQLIEGFAPAEIASLMDFITLKNLSGNDITPLFEERFEEVDKLVGVTRCLSGASGQPGRARRCRSRRFQ